MDSSAIWIAALGVLSLGTLAYYFWQARRPSALPAVPGGMDLGVADVVFGGLLAAYYMLGAAAAVGGNFVINFQVIVKLSFHNLCQIIIVIAFLVIRSRNPFILFGLKWRHWQRGVGFVVLSLVALYPLLFFTQLLMQVIFGQNAQPQDILLYLKSITKPEEKFVAIFMAVVVAPLTEEVIFRGYFLGILRKYAGRWPAIIITSLFFAAIHVHLPSFAGLFFFAVALSLVYEAAGSLWASILMHAAFNAVTVAVLLLSPHP